MLLKIGFRSAPMQPPLLRVGKGVVEGARGDSAGLFWSFDAPGLAPATPYELQILDAKRKPLSDVWTLKTFPDPSEPVRSLRLLIYTCAGGHEVSSHPDGRKVFLSLERRRRMLDRALSFEPNALIANGDHVYWDLRTITAQTLGASPEGIAYAGQFVRTLPVFGTENEGVLLRAAGPQIAMLYETRFRSVPVFFITDDHDHYDDDRADDHFVSFPPDAFMLRLARATRRLYFPEFLPDANRPAGLAGSSAPDTPPGVAECYGTLRYGSLAELLLYDCRRYMTLAGPSAVFVPPETEQWITTRMAARGVRHVVNVPSLPIGWSAGKWGDWYPDVIGEDGRLGTSRPKPYWQEGWGRQHSRLLAAASAMRERVPLFLCGDLHALGDGRIHRAGENDLSRNPVTALLTGPISTLTGWPSAARGTPPLPPARLEMDERLKATEQNGFTIVDFTPDKITARLFRWTPVEPDEAIDRMEPFYTAEFVR
ncbi:MAG: alkaline phosphatase D family protein [Bryobacteraceae bacterium]